MCCSPRKGNIEAVFAGGAMLGAFILIDQGKLSTTADSWMFVQLLCVILGFYALLLLIRAVFTFMVGGDTFWWERYKEEDTKARKK